MTINSQFSSNFTWSVQFKSKLQPFGMALGSKLSSASELTAPGAIALIYSFSDVPTLVSEKVAQNLSVPIMFVCLLHLANEKNLSITGVQDLSDLKIAQNC
jgi:hypothetical protein